MKLLTIQFRKTLDYSSRVAYWSTVLEKSKRLADDFAALVDSGTGIEDVQPFTGKR